MKHIFLSSILFLSFALFVTAQETETPKTEDKPVKKTFLASALVDQQTVTQPAGKSLEFLIQHRFSTVKNGITDIFGIYGAANTRLSLTYGITDRIAFGIGTTQMSRLQDFSWKIALLRQTQSGSMPVSVSYYGNAVINASDKENFGDPANYKFAHRMSYLTQLIIARKFGTVASFQIAPIMAYYNAVDTIHSNINFALAIGGKVKITSSMAAIFEYQMPFTKTDFFTPKPNAALGFEVGTSTHSFQLFVASYNSIIYQQNIVNNINDFTKGDLRVGFNITIRF